MKLSYDTGRCMGEGAAFPCPQRDTCARYTQRETNTGERTSYTMWACSEEFEQFIRIEVTK